MKVFVFFIAVAINVTLSASPEPLSPSAKTDVLVWPAAPDPPRIQYLSSLPADLGDLAEKNEGFWSRAWRWVIGLGSGYEEREDRLVRPTGLFVQGRRLFIADPGAGRVLNLDLDGGSRQWIPAYPAPRLPSPVGVVVSPDGKRVYVSDSIIGKVLVYDSKRGKLLTRIRLPEGGRPTGLALDASRGLLYVADTGRHLIEVFTLAGKPLRSLGKRGSGPGEFNFPTYLWVEPASGVLWVADSLNFRLQSFNEKGDYLSSQGKHGDKPGFLTRPRGLVTDSEGHIYNVDGAMDAVQVFNRDGKLLLYFGLAGHGLGQFSLPGGLAMDGQDRLYVADTHNARVQVFQYLSENQP